MQLNNALAVLLVGFQPEKPEPVKLKPGKVPKLPDKVLELKRKMGSKDTLPTRTVIVRGGKWFTPAGYELVAVNVLKDYYIVGHEVKAPKIGLVSTGVPGALRTNWPSKGQFVHGHSDRPNALKGGQQNLS